MFPMKAIKDKVEYCEGDGLYHQEWKFSSLGSFLSFSFLIEDYRVSRIFIGSASE